MPIRLIITGRSNILEKESWRKLQQDRNLIHEQELECFDQLKTKEYLEKIKSQQSEQIENIFQITKGLPYYLNWIRQREEKGSPLDFSQGNQEIVNLLLQELNNNQKQVIKIAACCHWFKKPLIEYLCQKKGLNFQDAVDRQQDCFEWLKQRDFVEHIKGKYRLDDVARDVFQKDFCEEDEDEFREIHGILADYFKEQANEEVSANSPPPEMYNNSTWRRYIGESLYHQLFLNKKEVEQEFISYLFASRYFRQDEIVQIPFESIIAEVEFLKDAKKDFLSKLFPAIVWGWAIFEEELIDYVGLKNVGISTAQVKETLNHCFNYLNSLTGIAKFAALLYKSKRCPPNDQVNCLHQARVEAEKIITDADQEFSSGLFLWGLSNRFYELKLYEEAIASYDKAVEIKPDDHQAWNNRGVVLGNLGRYEEEIASWDKAVEIKPDDHEAWYNRGVALGNLGRDEEEIASWDKAVEIKPDDHEAWYNRGVALGNLGRYEEAIASWDKAVEIKPDDHQAWYNRGVALGNLGRYEEAIASYDKAVEIKPDDHQAWYNRGVALGNLGRYEEAIASYDKAVEIKPDKHQAWNNRGVALGNLGRYEEAIASWDKAVEIKPDDPNTYYNKACCYGLQNNVELAIENLQRAISLDSQYRDMAKTDKDFDKIREDVRFQELIQPS